MATIGEEVDIDTSIIVTNVLESLPVFDNTVINSLQEAVQYDENGDIYENTSGVPILTPIYNGADTYVVGDLVFADDNGIDKIQEITNIAGDFPKQPEDYSTGVDTSFDSSVWTKRYMEFLSTPAEYNNDSYHYVSGIIDMYMKSDGLLMYYITPTTIGHITLGSPFVFSSAIETITINLADISSVVTASSFFVKPEGDRIYISCSSTEQVHQLNMTAWDIGSLISVRTINEASYYTGQFRAVVFKSTGTRMYTIGGYSDGGIIHSCITEYLLPNAWNIDSKTRVSRTYAPSTYMYWTGGKFNDVGTKFYASSANYVDTFTLSAWDSSTIALSLEGTITPISGSSCKNIAFTTDGAHLYDIGNGYIRDFILPTAWDLETAFYSPTALTVWKVLNGKQYQFKIVNNNGAYSFEVTERWYTSVIEDFKIRVYTSLNTDSIEEVAYSSGDIFLAKTIIFRPDAVYIRTSVDIDKEIETLVDYKYIPLVAVSTLSEFSRIRSSNPYRPFDGSNITPAIYQSPMEYTIESNQEFNSFTLSKVLASSITYSFKLAPTSDEYSLWLDGVSVASNGNGVVKVATSNIDCSRDGLGRLSLYPTTVVYYSNIQMPIGSTVTISLNHPTDVELGDFTINNSITDGFTKMEFTHTIQDFNTYTPDAWGNIAEGIKPVVTKFNITVDILLENYDHVVSLHESLVRKFITIDASDSINGEPDSQNIFASLIRRVRITSVSHKTIVKDGDMWRMAGVTLAVQEIV